MGQTKHKTITRDFVGFSTRKCGLHLEQNTRNRLLLGKSSTQITKSKTQCRKFLKTF